MTQVFDKSGNRVLPPTDAERRSWPEDFGHENGNYWNRCVHCENQFIGHKRRVCCRLCASSDA